MKNPTQFHTITITIYALIAFAANSILCRLAMGTFQIDGASFTTIRLISGALTMLFIFALLNKNKTDFKTSEIVNETKTIRYFSLNPLSSWLAPLMLFGYAWCFSYAYIRLDTGTGALILFATVQLTMLGYNLFKGNRPNRLSWVGIIMAFVGFIYLMLPTATQPSLVGFMWMLVAGLCWAAYTLLGKSSNNAILDTGVNFIRSVPLAIIAMVLTLFISGANAIYFTFEGVIFAIFSGSLASACGYTIWYFALKKITITQAAVSQLSVPVLAAIGGFIVLAEPLTGSFIVSAGLILIGIMLTYLKPNASKT